MQGSGVKAGVARAVITPPIGTPLVGFAGRASSDAIHDQLTATALVIDQADSTRVALICCDLLSLDTEVVDQCRSAIGALTGIGADGVVIACSHTHYGPATATHGLTVTGGQSPQVAPYVQNLAHTLAGVVLAACGNLVDGRLYSGTGEVTIGINRRERIASGEIILGQNPAGPFDPSVRVLRVDSADGRPLAAVVNYACHPVSFSSSCTHISADFPGVVRRVVEESTGATCLFMQGAAGDVNPLLMGWNWDHLDRSGLPLGAEAVRAYFAADQVDADGSAVAVRRKLLELPQLLPESEDDAAEELATLEEQQRTSTEPATSGRAYWANRRIGRLRDGLAVLQGRAERTPVRAEISAVALGPDLGVITAPGEIFTEIGASILARSPFARNLYCGYTNGSIHYVPTRAAYAEGGYEVNRACIVAPEAGEMLEAESVTLLEAAHAATR